MVTRNDSSAADSPDFTHTTAPHADWIAAARAEVARCDDPGAEMSSARAGGAPDSPANLRVLLGDRYELGEEIRRGGQGVVYRGVQRGTRRDVAIKVMFGGRSADPVGRARFEREAQILAQLRHPNIVTIHESGGAANSLYYVMDFIPGEPLDEHIRAQVRDPRAVAALFVKICDAVNIAHLRGVLHRDLKPSNIRVDPAGEPHVLDFGLAKISSQFPVTSPQFNGPASAGTGEWKLETGDCTETGQFLGSVPWASPEQVAARPDEMDLRTDVYSLGVMLYQFLTGYFPYPVNGPVRSVLENICTFEPKNPSEISRSVGDDLAQVVLKCLRKQPEDRYQTAGDVARELRRFLAGEPIEAKRDQTWYMLRKRLRRYRTFTLVSSLLALLVLGSLVALTAFYREEHRLRTAAETAQKEAEAARAEATAARNDAQRALQEEAAQRKLAEKYAGETRQVAKFQSALLESLDAEAMGREIKELFREHVRATLQRPPTAGDSEQRARTEADVATELAVYDTLTAAVPPVDVVRRALAKHVLGKVPETVASRFADQPRVQAELLLTLGATLRNLGLFAEAEPHLRRALELARGSGAVANVIDQLTAEADILSHLGGTLSHLGRLAEAEAVHREAYEIMNRIGPNGSPDASSALGNIAAMRAAQGDATGAVNMFREAVEKARQAPSPDRQAEAIALGNLGTVLAQRGDFQEAEPYLRKALAMRESELGPEHESLAVDLANLGNLYTVRGEPQKAEPLLRRALAIYRARLGKEHPHVGHAMTSLALLIRDRDPEGARRLYEEALANYRAALGENHAKTAMALDNVGSILRQMGDYAAAEPLIRAGLARRRVLFPEDHPEIVQSLNNLARLLLSRGATVEAADHYREGIAISERLGMPAQHEKMVAMRVGLGRSLTALGEWADAQRQLELAEIAIADGASISDRIRRSFLEGWVELHRALHALRPDAGHGAKGDEWSEKLRTWQASTQPATP